MLINKLASAIKNDVLSGIQGFHSGSSISLEQLEDDIILERMSIIKEYTLKGILPTKDLLLSINCVPVDCKDLDRCSCSDIHGEPQAHFEIPQLMMDYGNQAISYVGSTDRREPFTVYTGPKSFKYHQYRKRGSKKPFVWIDTTPNKNGMNDGFIFNAPMIEMISVVGIFKDPRQMEQFNCCIWDDNFSFIDNEVKQRLTQKKIQYYRQAAAQPQPNDQSYTA